MQETFGDQAVIATWNLDHEDSAAAPSESLRRSVVDQLKRLNMTSQNFIAGDPMQAILTRYGVFGLPAALVFGADGELAKVFEGEFTYDKDVAPFVRESLQ